MRPRPARARPARVSGHGVARPWASFPQDAGLSQPGARSLLSGWCLPSETQLRPSADPVPA